MAIGALDGWKSVLIFFTVIIPLGMWLAALADIVKSHFKTNSNKIMWLLIVTLVPVIGVLFYRWIGTKQKVS